jgi:hypothetical protein
MGCEIRSLCGKGVIAVTWQQELNIVSGPLSQVSVRLSQYPTVIMTNLGSTERNVCKYVDLGNVPKVLGSQ